MQSGYGTPQIHHHQLFTANNDVYSPPSSAFSMSNPDVQNQYIFHSQHPQQEQQQQQKQEFHQLLHQQQHIIPITKQMFQNPHRFQAFQQTRRMHHNPGLRHELGREVVGQEGASTATFPFFTVNFKLGLNANENGFSNQEEEEQQGFFHGIQHHVSECKPNSPVMLTCWQTQEDSVIKEPFWKPLNGQCDEDEEELERISKNYFNSSQLDHRSRHFGELEAIYGSHTSVLGEVNQTGSGSAVTGENSPKNASLPAPIDELNCHNVTANGAPIGPIGFDHGSEASIGEEPSLRKTKKNNKKRKRKTKGQLSSVAAGFFERLVKQLIDHQENLHRKFLEAIEKMDVERIKREESLRLEELMKFNRESIARAHEQAQSSCREAAIVSCLEKITGQSINLPVRKTPLHIDPTTTKPFIQNESTGNELNFVANNKTRSSKANKNELNANTKNRWPEAEVEALIRVRRGLETKFQEQGLKEPLWEEISTSMASMGYSNSAKRMKNQSRKSIALHTLIN